MSIAIHGITRGSWCAAVAAAAMLAGGTGQARAGTLYEWSLPNPTGGSVVAVAPVGSGVGFIQQTPSLTTTQVGWTDGSQLLQWSVPIGGLSWVATSPKDGSLFVASPVNTIARIESETSTFCTKWTIPGTYGEPTGSFAFDATGDLFYASMNATSMWIVRLSPSFAAPQVTAWAMPSEIGTPGTDATGDCAVDSKGRVCFTVNGPAHNMIARLEPSKNAFTYWDLAPFVPTGGVDVGPGDSIFFQEQRPAPAVSYMSQLFPGLALGVDVLDDWTYAGEFGTGGRVSALGASVAFTAKNAAGSVLGTLDSTVVASFRAYGLEGKAPAHDSPSYANVLTQPEGPPLTLLYAGAAPAPKINNAVTGAAAGPQLTNWPVSPVCVTANSPWGGIVFGEQPDQIGWLQP